MSPKIKSDPERVTLSQPTLHNMDQTSKSRHTPLVQGYPNLPSRHTQDDDLSSQDNFPLCSSAHHGNGTLGEMRSWTLNDADVLDNISSTKTESPEVQLLSFSLSQQLLPSTVGPSDVIYHTGPDFPVVPDLTDHHDMDFSHSHDFHQYSSLVDLNAFDNDSCTQNGAHSHTPEDALSSAHSHHGDDGQMFAANENWNSMITNTRNYHGLPLDHFSSNIFPPMPVSPPLTEAGHDMSVASSCSHSGYPTYVHDDVLMKDMASSSAGPHGINLGEPMFPLTPPVSEKDRNRTIRPPKHARRPTLQATGPESQMEKEPEFFQPPTARETVKLKSKDTEMRNPRDHPYYALPAQSDGKYYCPFSSEETPCNHPPTTQKCAYHKYLDSHLKPYRCKVSACLDAQLQFSSNACLFRHEREAHGLHGHGDNPHLCFFEGCDRSVPGYGFPRRWNLFDHMRRVHDYIASEQPSSPETSSSSHVIKRKETSGRKRRVTGTSGAQPMKAQASKAQTIKRTRSTHSQANPLKATQTPTHHGQRLSTAERNYYNCRSRLLQELGEITPRDSAMNERVNATVQELMTLGLNYRHIEASQAATATHGLPM